MTDPPVTISLRGLWHGGQHCIGIHFLHNLALNNALKKAGARWSKTHTAWHVALSKQNYLRIAKAIGQQGIIDRSELDAYLRSIQHATGSILPTQAPGPAKPNYHERSNSQPKAPAAPEKPVGKVNLHVMPAMEQHLILKGYSPNTKRTYLGEMRQYLQVLGSYPADSMTVQRIKDYLSWCHTHCQLSENTIHSRMNALKFYYEQVLHREKFFWEIPRPKKPLQLPKVISEEKIVEGLLSIENLKHRALLMLAYSAGLRVSEAVAVKLENLDTDRMQVHIQRGKGKKDRMVPLSAVALQTMQKYLAQYRPAFWLFEGQFKDTHLSNRTAQILFRNTFQKLGIPEHTGFHSLRHSYATHLLENGTDISIIQKLLGHNDIKTTLRYTHMSQKTINKIESPLDKIMRKKARDP
jgi:site-specific recombinase XerD